MKLGICNLCPQITIKDRQKKITSGHHTPDFKKMIISNLNLYGLGLQFTFLTN